MLRTMSLLPPDDDLELLHDRRYEVRVYVLDDDTMLVRGAIADTKPPGLYVPDDPSELEIHQMQVEWHVALPTLEITHAAVVFETHPHESCPAIATHYRKLVGLCVARGFTHKVRELFGGPRGCTHTTALLQAMAPAVVQSTWSVAVRRARLDGEAPGMRDPEERERQFAGNVNTCHIWDEDGAHVAGLRNGILPPPPLPVSERMVSLGRDPDSWRLGD